MEAKKLSDIEMIDNVIALTYNAIAKMGDADKADKAIAKFEKMLRLKQNYSDEFIQKWLLDKGYVAVPMAEFAPLQENNDRDEDQPSAIAFDDILGRVSEIEPTIIPNAVRTVESLGLENYPQP